MNEEFLLGLGLDEAVSGEILKKLSEENLNRKIKDGLKKLGVSDEAAAEKLLVREGITEENYMDRVESLKKSHPLIFKSKAPHIIGNADSKDGVDRSKFEKMTYRERLEFFKKSPEQYKKMTE
ncbi:MAG: hypothetical protein Q4B31_02865 [Clostridia bacterium]|nr:hypothetical protein [Clostridia bacterium]